MSNPKTRAQLMGALERLQNRLKMLEAADALRKEQFLATINHELRTPLNGVLGMLDLLLESQLAPDQYEFAVMAKESALLLLDKVSDILNFATLENGSRPMMHLNFDLHTTLAGVTEMCAVRAREKGLAFVFEVSHDVPSLLNGDPEGVRQILSSIVGNAIKFTSHGRVHFQVHYAGITEKGEVLIEFVITDNGIGIPAASLGILFEPFTQVDNSSTRRYGGTGIGLAIARQLALSMDGDIRVMSEEGKGSVFTVTIPFLMQSESLPAVSEPPNSLSSHDWHILVVEDTTSNRRLLKILLENWGCRCEEAEDALQALEKLQTAITKQDPFHVAFLDMFLPGMDGETLGAVIKQDATLKNTALVMLTSMGKRGDVSRLEKAGFAAYFTKPVDGHQLQQCLTTIMTNLAVPLVSHPIITRYSVAEATHKKIPL